MQPLLVLWDVDHTLVNAGASGAELYRLVLDELYGLSLPRQLPSMAGRTDRAIAADLLAAAGLPASELSRFNARLADRAPELAGFVKERAIVLPGASAALAALARPDHGRRVLQSLLTGNIPQMAELKVGALGLSGFLDLAIGAYGNISTIRADLVPVARQNAAARYGGDYAGSATVLVGDTPKDVEAALATGARAVAVATGSFGMQQLAEAGANVVLPDLTDTGQVVAAVLGDGS